jgi:hypothetical protein
MIIIGELECEQVVLREREHVPVAFVYDVARLVAYLMHVCNI